MTTNVGSIITDWFNTLSAEDFPTGGKTDYTAQFNSCAQYMVRNIHPEVEKGAAANEPHSQLFLNNHGPEHVAAVINKASAILNAANATVTPYEAYLLLFAIHLHDTGNLFGRDRHEHSCRHVMELLGTRAGDDKFEKRWIVNIAAAHGGKTADGDKDTISRLIPEPEITLLGERVRPQFLAALLRLADELADDRSRASRFAMEAGAIPEPSRIFHHYSQSLHSVSIGEREVTLSFEFSNSIARALFLKADNPSCLLLDEIFARTIKMHMERMYCMRYLRPVIRLDEIRAHIEVFADDYSERLTQLRYRLVEMGYPAAPHADIHAMCPDLTIWNGDMLVAALNGVNEVKK